MDLLARYLQAVKFFLPQRQQDDIVRELSENLLAQFEDQAETLGRPLTEAEQAEILKRTDTPRSPRAATSPGSSSSAPSSFRSTCSP